MINKYIFLVERIDYENTEIVLATDNFQKAIDLTFKEGLSLTIWFNDEYLFSIDGNYDNKEYLNLELDEPIHGALLRILVESINKKHEEHDAQIERNKIKKLEEKTQKELETLRKLKEKYENA